MDKNRQAELLSAQAKELQLPRLSGGFQPPSRQGQPALLFLL